MPTIHLSSAPLDVSFARTGVLTLGPNSTGVPRVLLRRLKCPVRYTDINTGTAITRQAVVDTGAPLSCFPKAVWQTDFGWHEGVDYELLTVPGVSQLRGSVLGFSYDFHLVRLLRPIEVVSIRPPFRALSLGSVIAQLAEDGGPPEILLGLWGNVLEGTSLRFTRRHNSDDIDPFLEW